MIDFLLHEVLLVIGAIVVCSIIPFLWSVTIWKRMTVPFLVVLWTIPELVVVITLLATNRLTQGIIVGALSIASMISLVTLRLTALNRVDEDGERPQRFRYNKRVLSLSIFKNLIVNASRAKNNGEKFVGFVTPTSKSQIPYNARKIFISNKNAKRGILISGSTSSGKTFQVMSFVRQDLQNKSSVIYFDFKGDQEVADDVANHAHNAGVDVYTINEQTANFFLDPFENLTTNGRVEAIMNMRKWDPSGADAHYRTGTQLFLQKTITTYEESLTKNPSKTRSFLYGYRNFLEQISVPRELFDSYTTVKKLLDLCITSGIGMMADDNRGAKKLDIASDTPFCLICSFSSSSKELATMMCSVLTRTILAQGTISPFKNMMFYIDEFGSAENPYIVKDQVEKGRKCGISTTLIVQDINQIIINSNEHYLDSLLGTMNTFLIFPGATRKAAEMLSGVQTNDIQRMLMLLRSPDEGKPGTAIFIAKYSAMKKNSIHEVYHFSPQRVKLENSSSKIYIKNEEDYTPLDDCEEESVEYELKTEKEEAELKETATDKINMNFEDML